MKAILIGDVHLSDRPPSIRRETYAQDVLDKLAFAVNKAAELDCDAIISAGDMFHIKTPSRTSHALVQSTAEVLTSQGIPVKIVPGNHDMQHDRIDSLPKQPLGTLALTEGIDLLMGWDESLPLFGLPFLYDYTRELDPWMDRWSEEKSKHDRPLMVTHAPIFPPGQTAIYDFIAAEDWAAKADIYACYYGHIHDHHGSYVANGVIFCNQGALSRGSLHEGTLKRKPAVTFYDSEANVPFTRIEVPHRPVEEVFRLSVKAAADDEQKKLDSFLGSVEETQLEGLSIEAVLAHVDTLDLKPGTRQVITEVIEGAMP